MSDKKGIFIRIIKVFMLAVIAIQAIFGIVWICCNFAVEPIEKLSLDYIRASEQIRVDEYMGILYAVFLKFVMLIPGGMASDLFIIRILQLACIGVSVFLLPLKKISDKFIAAAFVMTNPFVLFTASRIMPKAFVAAGILGLTGLVIRFLQKPRLQQIIGMLVIQAFISGFHPDAAAIFMITIFPLVILGCKKIKKYRLAIAAVMVAIATAMISVNALSTDSLSYHRASRTPGILAMQRFAWPDLMKVDSDIREMYILDYDYKVKSATNCVDLLFEDLGYEFEIAAGKGKASKFFLYEAKNNFARYRKNRVMAVLKDFAYYSCPVLSIPLMLALGENETRLPWVISTFTDKDPAVFWIYLSFSAVANLILCFLFIILYLGVPGKKKELKNLGIIIATVVFLAVYYTFFNFRGFDPCNCLFAMLWIPLMGLGILRKY